MLNRRDFARLAAAAAATPVLAHTALAQAAAPDKKIRYAVIGLGRISMGHFMPGTRRSQFGEITALVSGHPDKAHKVAADYNIPDSSIYTYENFDGIKNNPNVDAVYVALPNNMHAEYTIRAAQAGKHVLCEKPMATSVADCHAMIDACRKANRKLMIAYRCHFVPAFLQARDIIRSGGIGKIQTMESTYGFNESLGEWRLDKKLAGGGPMMDVGIYCLNACRFLTKEEPAHVQAFTSVIDHDGRFDGVEENLSWIMKFPSGAVASCATTYGAGMDSFIRVHGSKGTLEIAGFNYDNINLTVRYREGTDIAQHDNRKDPAQFTAESDHFSRCVMDSMEPEPNGEEGLRDMEIIARLYESASKNGSFN